MATSHTGGRKGTEGSFFFDQRANRGIQSVSTSIRLKSAGMGDIPLAHKNALPAGLFSLDERGTMKDLEKHRSKLDRIMKVKDNINKLAQAEVDKLAKILERSDKKDKQVEEAKKQLQQDMK